MANPNIWAPGEAINANSSIRFESFTASADQTVFSLTDFQYAVGTGSLMVFVSGIAQRPGIDFYETSVGSFTFATAVSAGTIVLAMGMVEVSAVIDQTGPLLYVYEATGGETTVYILDFTYTVGSNNLVVLRNGLEQIVNYDYTESSENTIILSEALVAGEKITFRVY